MNVASCVADLEAFEEALTIVHAEAEAGYFGILIINEFLDPVALLIHFKLVSVNIHAYLISVSCAHISCVD